MVSWNVLRDAVFNSSFNETVFRRVILALQPDILLLQEVYDEPTQAVLEVVRETLQLGSGQSWSIARNRDCITISRFPIERSWSTDGNLISRIDTRELLGRQIVLGNVHFPCCSNEQGRVSEARMLLNRMEAALEETGFGPQTPIVAGDLNSGGLAPELILLKNGDRELEMANCRHIDA